MDRHRLASVLSIIVLIGVWLALRPSVWPLILLLVILFVALFSWMRGR